MEAEDRLVGSDQETTYQPTASFEDALYYNQTRAASAAQYVHELEKLSGIKREKRT
jgi:hypothetical protein